MDILLRRVPILPIHLVSVNGAAEVSDIYGEFVVEVKG